MSPAASFFANSELEKNFFKKMRCESDNIGLVIHLFQIITSNILKGRVNIYTLK